MTFHVLFVCTGNLCRSPAAELLLRARLDALGAAAITVGSAGLGVGRGIAEGLRIDRTVESLLAKRGVTAGVDAFRSQAVTPELVERADLVLTATREQRIQIGREWPGAYPSTYTLGEAAWMLSDGRPALGTEGPRAVPEWLQEQRGLVVAPEDEADIPDPIGRRTGVYRRVVEQIAGAVDVVADALLSRR